MVRVQSSTEGQQRQTCDYNQQLIYNQRSLESVERFLCNICPFNSTSRLELQHHNKVKHLNHLRKPFFGTQMRPKFHACEYCAYKSILKSDVTRHMRTHTGERPFRCELCPYRATLQYNLDKHMNSHSCGICDYRSGNKQMLQCHRQTHRK